MILIGPWHTAPDGSEYRQLISTLPGAAGYDELTRFGSHIDLRREWLNNAGTPKEHFKLYRARPERAIGAGALPVTAGQIGLTIRDKREALAGPDSHPPHGQGAEIQAAWSQMEAHTTGG